MNFKFFICIIFMTLISSIHGYAPVTEDYNLAMKLCHEDKTSTGFVDIKGDNDVTFTCIRKYQSFVEILNPPYTCFYSNLVVYCINEMFSNIEICEKNGKKFDYEACGRKIMELTDGKNYFPVQIRKFPFNESFVNSYKLDKQECEYHNGILLTYKVVHQHICITPGSHYINIMVNGKNYSIERDITTIDYCNNMNKKFYNLDLCYKAVVEYGKANGYQIQYIQ